MPETPAIDLVDETFIAVPPATVAAVFKDPRSWRHYWPDLHLTVYADRGDEGLRWTVSGALVGTMEVWCERVMDGTVLHYFLRADPVGAHTRRQLVRARDRRAKAAKQLALNLKLTLEDGRRPGVPPTL
ncbi:MULTISPECIES: hypothetical protein [Thermocrispum]|uniref:Polyketide cyclase / dehydrase and lipid transport n=1 Tax=Thermocrispum agreste TaxID=37925 RepID=A0ABD6FL86_9PSEU|nr:MULTISPECIES: hypothetical protein [Thermocrispum]